MSFPKVLVTGGTGTLGREVVRVLSQNFSVTANYSQNQARALQVQAETGCDLYRADIGDEEQVNQLFDDTAPFYAVVHVAGIARDELLVRQKRVDWDTTQRINLDAAFLVARRSLEDLQEGGRLIFFASRVGQIGERGQTAYAASKAGVLALMQTAAREGAARRLAINSICPGFVPSAMNDGLDLESLPHAKGASVFHELGSPQETAGLVRWLLAPEAGAVSGQIFHCHSRL
jgi:3-oxoacyl-[acyl-carrier protein] reductase